MEFCSKWWNYITPLFGISIFVRCNNDGKNCIPLDFSYLTIFLHIKLTFCCFFPVSKSGSATANMADSYVGSTAWAYASSRKTGRNTYKCNIFVAEFIEQAGKSVPHRHWWKWSPIGAAEWANPNSSYLTSASCWSVVTGCYKRGDVAATGGHVGIVTGKDATTSASSIVNSVVKNDWGFRAGQRLTFWRYTF